MKITDRHLLYWAERRFRRTPHTVSVHALIPQERRSKGEHHAGNLMKMLRMGLGYGAGPLTQLATLKRFADDNPRTPCPRRAAFAKKWLRRIQREEERRERLRLGLVSHNLKITPGFYVTTGYLTPWPPYVLPQGKCSRKR